MSNYTKMNRIMEFAFPLLCLLSSCLMSQLINFFLPVFEESLFFSVTTTCFLEVDSQ